MTATMETPPICRIVADAYPRNRAKLAARAFGCSVRTAEAYSTGRRSPSAWTLLRAAAACERLADALDRYLVDARRRQAAGSAAAAGSGAAASGPAVTR